MEKLSFSELKTGLGISVLKISGLILVSEVPGLDHKPVVLKLSILQGYGFVKLL